MAISALIWPYQSDISGLREIAAWSGGVVGACADFKRDIHAMLFISFELNTFCDYVLHTFLSLAYMHAWGCKPAHSSCSETTTTTHYHYNYLLLTTDLLTNYYLLRLLLTKLLTYLLAYLLTDWLTDWLTYLLLSKSARSVAISASRPGAKVSRYEVIN